MKNKTKSYCMAEVVGVLFVLAASVSWYVSKSLQSKVDPDKDGYGEGMRYVKYKDNNMPSYNIKVQPAASNKFVTFFIHGDDCEEKWREMPYDSYVDKYKKLWGLDPSTDLVMKCRQKHLKNPFKDNKKVFIDEVVKQVAARLDTGNRVLLAGHSYGGRLACHVAAALMHKLQDVNNDVNRYDNLLHVATFGNSKPYDNRIYQNMSLTHYMIKDDVASLGRFGKPKITPPKSVPSFDRVTNVFWLDHRAKLGHPLGFNSVQNELHNNYDDVISAVIKNQGQRLKVTDVSIY